MNLAHPSSNKVRPSVANEGSEAKTQNSRKLMPTNRVVTAVLVAR